MKKQLVAAALSLSMVGASVPGPVQATEDGQPFKRVLLISIDGMHAVDLINCSEGLTDINGGAPYCPNLLKLRATGVNYLETSTSKPSDSFPGLTAIISGGSPRTEGVFYDVAYDRSLAPPAKTTGNGVAGAPDLCQIGNFNGTTTEYEEGIDIDQSKLNGGAPFGDGGVDSIDKDRLPRDPANNCAPVYPWNFVRTNTIFGVIHEAGGYTAWSDKHPAYASVSGPTTKGPANVQQNLDDFYAPEINSIPVSLPGITPDGQKICDPIADPNWNKDPTKSALGAYTDSFVAIKCYDQLKVNAILNEIAGLSHNGRIKTRVPMIFGMNFQAVSVGQKLIEKGFPNGGYLDAIGTPGSELLGEIAFVDGAIGQFVAELKKKGLYDSTLIVITAKHGQSPIDSQRYTGITASGPVTTSPADILANCLPFSESPANPNGIGPTQDDISLLWLSSNCTTETAVSVLEEQSPASHNIAGIGEIFSGPSLRQMFNPPGLPPVADPRSPDIIVTPNIGVTYSGSTKKLAEHGGFSHDDTNVMMLWSNPSFSPKTVFSPVETMQVAPTILKALGLEPNSLQAVRRDHTQVLPGVPLTIDKD